MRYRKLLFLAICITTLGCEDLATSSYYTSENHFPFYTDLSHTQTYKESYIPECIKIGRYDLWEITGNSLMLQPTFFGEPLEKVECLNSGGIVFMCFDKVILEGSQFPYRTSFGTLSFLFHCDNLVFYESMQIEKYYYGAILLNTYGELIGVVFLPNGENNRFSIKTKNVWLVADSKIAKQTDISKYNIKLCENRITFNFQCNLSKEVRE